MTKTYPQIDPKKLTGSESLHDRGNIYATSIIDFWAWSSSDLLSNAKRGVFAEFIVASDLGVTDGVRAEWDAYDLETKSGITVEVKSAAYIQSWHQEKPSAIGFSIAPSRAWDPAKNKFSSEVKRQAQVYVFCLLRHLDQNTVDPLNMDQWQFYVVPTSRLNEHCGERKRISLTKLEDLSPSVTHYGEINSTIEAVCGES